MRYLKPLRPFLAWSQLSIPTVYDDSLSYYEVLNKCIFHFNEMLKIMQENYEIIDEAFAKILEECEAAIARCEEAAERAEAAQSAAEKAQAAAEAAQAAAEAAQKLAEAAQAAAEAARDDAVTAQKAAEAAQKAAEAAQAAAEAAQKKAETAQEAAEAAQAKAEDAQEKAESARDAAQAAQAAAEAAHQKAEEAQTAAESARDAAEAAQRGAEAAQEAAEASEQAAADSARDAAASAEEIKNALDNYYDKTESDATFVKKSGDTMTGDLVMSNSHVEGASSAAYFNSLPTELTDLNNLNTNGYFVSSENLSNAPNFKYYLLYNNIVSGINHITQIAFQRITGNNIALRNYNNTNSSWSNWTYFTTQDDITGNYLPLSGGTMTGNINVQDEWNDTFTGLSKGNYVTPISENSDLNNVKSNCVNFYHSVAATSEESKNFPAKISGFLVTLARDSLTYTRQIYYATLTNNIYTRIYNSSSNSWSNWDKIVTTAEINNSLSGYLPLTGGTMTGDLVMSNSHVEGASSAAFFNLLPEDVTDLNNLNTNGFYVSDNSVTNSPNFSSYVLYNNIVKGSRHITQVAFQRIIGNNIAVRNFNGNTSSWSNWTYFTTQDDITGNYLPLSGGTMTGNITMSADTKLIGNAETSDFFKLIHIPNASDMNKIIDSGFYAISSGDSVSNAPEEVSTETNAFSCFVFPWQYSNTTGISQLLFSGDGTTVKGVYLRLTNNPNVGWGNWVRLDNITEEPTNGTPIFYKRVYSTDNKFFANIYKIAGEESKAKVDIYVNNLDSEFNLSFSTDYETFPSIFKIDEKQSTFNGEDLPFDLKTTMDLVIGNYMVEKGSKYIGLVNLNYIIGFSGGSSYIKPYFNGILLESSVLNKGTISGNYPVFITSFINNVNSSWSWD